MRLTVVGCGDAFGSGGRGQSCFRVEAGGLTLCLDFGATALNAYRRLGLDPREIDVVVLSHLHGDHFGGLPFLMLDGQFDGRRDRPLTIVGPIGTRARLELLLEAFFPGSSANNWRFPFEVVDLPCGQTWQLGRCEIVTREVVHPSGAPPTSIRLTADDTVLAYSGDTAWTDALVPACRSADLLIMECYVYRGQVPAHLDFPTILAHREAFGAKRTLLTHLGRAALGHVAEMEAEGYLVAHDGLVLDI